MDIYVCYKTTGIKPDKKLKKYQLKYNEIHISKRLNKITNDKSISLKQIISKYFKYHKETAKVIIFGFCSLFNANLY